MHEHVHPGMVQEYYVARLRTLAREHARRLAAIQTRTQAQDYRQLVADKIRGLMQPLPASGPVIGKCTGKTERFGLTIEKLLLESRPGYHVSCNLYLPGKVPVGRGYPAVLLVCGHSGNGKAYYQVVARSLALQGYAVLAKDPMGQGERGQYEGLAHAEKVQGPCAEHNMAGKGLHLLGEHFASWRIWDALRCGDYLLSRPEIDGRFYGVTGGSGGGTLSSYVQAVDPRVTAAAPWDWATTLLHNVENELPTDAEQCIPGFLAAGLDCVDYYIARAPKPLLLVGQGDDFFDRRGLAAIYQELQRIYGLLGAAENVQLYLGPDGHVMTPQSRGAIYQFFARHSGLKGSRSERGDNLSDEELSAAPKQKVVLLAGEQRASALIAQRGLQAAAQRQDLQGPALAAAVAQTLGLPLERSAPPHYRTLRPLGKEYGNGKHAAYPFAVETDAGAQGDTPTPAGPILAILHAWDACPRMPGRAVVWRAHPPVLKEAVLYLPHLSSKQDVADGLAPVGEDLFLSLDVRGLGRSLPLSCGDEDFASPYGADYMYAAHGLMLGEDYLGRRVLDVLRTLDLLKALGTRQVHLQGRGLGAILAALAGCLHPLVSQVTLRHGLLSFHELTQQPAFDWPLSALPFAALTQWDLPDCYRELMATKTLQLLEPWDGQMQPWKPAALTRQMTALGLAKTPRKSRRRPLPVGQLA